MSDAQTPTHDPRAGGEEPGPDRDGHRLAARTLDRLSDEELVARARTGAPEPFAVLWSRHADAGRRAAGRFTSASDPDDLVQEAYLRIYSAVSRGKGPEGPFRPYLYQSIRNIAITWSRRPQTDSIDLLPDLSDGKDISEGVLEGTVTAKAFRTLPARWQEVLWYSEVEGLEPVDIAPLLAMSPGAVSALAYRAREGLRRAWLQAHVSSTSLPDDCRWSAEHMGDANRDALSGRARERFDAHVGGCTRCAILVAEVDEVSGRLGLVLVPLLVGVPWATFQPLTGHPALVGDAVSGEGATTVVRRSGSVALAVATVVGLAAVSAAVVLGSGMLRSSQAPAAPGAAPQGTTQSPVPEGPTSSSVTAPEVTPDVVPDTEAPSDADASRAPDDDRAAPVPPRVPPRDRLPSTDGPLALPALPALPPFEPISLPVTTPAVPADPTQEPSTSPPDIAPPGVPTLVGPVSETPLVAFPTVSGTADPGVTVVLTTTAGEALVSTVASSSGAWSAAVCADASAAPAACLGDVTTLTVEAHARDESTALVSGSSASLSWTFDRPTVAEPSDGSSVVPTDEGDVMVRLEGIAGQNVQVSIDGAPTGNYHSLPADQLTWSDVTPGTHTLRVRYVTVSGSGTDAVVTGFGPFRTSTVTVAAPRPDDASPRTPDTSSPPLGASRDAVAGD